MGLFNFFILLFIIVMLHEGGHLVVAKMNKVQVNTFSIGFGWRIIGFKFFKSKFSGKVYISWQWFNFKPYKSWLWNYLDGTEYRIAPILFGGFCAMDGETKGTGKSTDLVSKTYLQKVCVALAGVAVNFVTGFLAIFAVVVSKVGIKESVGVTFKYLGLMFNAIGMAVFELCIGQGQITTASETAKVMTGLTWEMYLLFFGVFSITLGLFNLLPIPALDGSLPLLWLVEKWHKNGQVIVSVIVRIGFVILMILQLIILFYWVR